MRENRLYRDLQFLTALDERSKLIDISYQGNLPERYHVTYHCRSLVWLEGNPLPAYSCRHELDIYLHRDYPRNPPALKWLTEIFHPNILPPRCNGGVCIGGWTAAETLDNLCLRIGEMLQFKSFSLQDPLNKEAASWAAENRDMFPVDDRCLLGPLLS